MGCVDLGGKRDTTEDVVFGYNMFAMNGCSPDERG